jgi:hypothetical protein
MTLAVRKRLVGVKGEDLRRRIVQVVFIMLRRRRW